MIAIESESNSSQSQIVQVLTVAGVAVGIISMFVTGILAARVNLDLIPVLPLLAIPGLACCIGAIGTGFKESCTKGPFRRACSVMVWLTGTFGVAYILWTVSHPAENGPGAGIVVLGIIMACTAIIGIIGLLLSPIAFLLLSEEEERVEGPSAIAYKFDPESRTLENAVRKIA